MNLDKYDGLIFDLDGTLIATANAHNEAWEKALANHNLGYDSKLRDKLGGASTLFMATAFLEAVNSDLPPEQLIKEKNAILKDILHASSSLLPLVDLVKQQFGKKKMAVGTGSNHEIAVPLLAHFDLLRYFDVIVTASDVKNHKPAPDTFLRCAELLGLKPSDCVVFEDADFGLQAAKSAGMDAIDVREF